MLKMLFGSWLVILFFFALLLFGGGLYFTVNPGFVVGSVKGLYGLGAIILYLWVFIAIVIKKTS
ncbi:MAG: hypothetical protein HYT13_01985 [Candidatus Liptonbacteria bacterium]|nr:hypothetical protein [Candidatus Liptonbacteria bacterium]